MICSDEFDIICITETWLTKTITDGLIDPDMRCRIIRCDRSDRGGGGVCVLVNKRLEVVEIPVAKYFPLLEVVCIDIYSGADRVRLFTVYRQPTYDVNSVAYITQLTECCAKFANCKSPCYIVGDLNCPAVDWSRCTAPADSVQDALLNFAVKYSFVQMVTDRTHGSNILDIILTNEPITLVDSKVIAPFANSDHCQVNFVIAFEKSSVSSVSECDAPAERTIYLCRMLTLIA